MNNQESWDEKSELLRKTLAASIDLSEAMRSGAETFLEWSRLRSQTGARARQDEAIKKARDLILEPSLMAVTDTLMDAVQLTFKEPDGRFSLVETIEDELRLLYFDDLRFRELQQLSDLLFELAEFCYTMHPLRVTKKGQRTRDPGSGHRYCSVCFRPSQRYELQYTHPSTYGNVLFRSSTPRDSDSSEGGRPSAEYCRERHSTSGDRLRSENRGKLASDNSDMTRMVIKREREGYEGTLEKLGLELPPSDRLRRIVAWYRARPRVARNELPRRIELLRRHRPKAKRLVDYVLSALPTYNPNNIVLDDSILMIEIRPDGYFVIVTHNGALVPLPFASWSQSTFQDSYAKALLRLKQATHKEFGERIGIDIATFEGLGVEISTLNGATICFVFDSPEWLVAACGLTGH